MSAAARIGGFAARRMHDAPGIAALALLAALEIVGQNVMAVSDMVNQQGVASVDRGQFQIDPSPGLAGILLPLVILSTLFGKRRPVRIMFNIVVVFTLVNTVSNTISVLGTINGHRGLTGAVTLLIDGGLLWVETVVIFAIWYWSSDAGGPDLRGTTSAKTPMLLFPQQEHQLRGYDNWRPRFHDYLHVSFVSSLSFHPAGAELLSTKGKYMSMLQGLVSVLILLLIVAKAVATFAAS